MKANPRRTLRIWELDHLAQRLGLSAEFLVRVAADEPRRYRVFTFWDKDKERRVYWAPRGSALWTVHQAIKRMLATLTLPRAILGGRKGVRLRDFAAPHIGKPLVMEVDIRRFYPSVTEQQVYALFKDQLDCSSEVAALLAHLTCADGHLQLGFSTSTHVANLLLRDAVWRLQRLAEQHDCDLTVWIDNIVLSGAEDLAALERTVVKIVSEAGVELHQARLMYRSEPQTICGVTVNNNLSWERSKREAVEEATTEIFMGRVPKPYATIDEAMCKLRSRLGGAKSMVPKQARKMRKLLEASHADYVSKTPGPGRVMRMVKGAPERAPGEVY
jgi:hypothetical protein